MKHVKKTNPPENYSNWCNIQRDLGVNYNFGSLQNPEKRELHRALVVEQGQICAYTMKRINFKDSHIEHIHPQSLCPIGLDLEYTNLLACYPRGNPKAKCPYGAEKKDGWWENQGSEFISPLNENCELKFYYKLSGKVKPVKKGSLAAKTTIKVLKLNYPTLKDERRLAIEEFIYGGERHALSPQEANYAIDRIYKPNEEGDLWIYCIAIHDALYEYLEIFERLSKSI